jgi:hypothetical protein
VYGGFDNDLFLVGRNYVEAIENIISNKRHSIAPKV